jgi:type III pantothenate kinase
MRVIDIGNTHTKIADFEGNCKTPQLIQIKLLSTQKTNQLDKYILPDNTLISSVTLKKVNHLKALVFDSKKIKIPIKILYKTPHSLGNDRLANAIAAWYSKPGTNHLVIDAGTCLKFDFVTQKGEYLGGSISPGLLMRYKALNHYTDKLPLLKPVKNTSYLGNNTVNSIHAGVIEGMCAEIKTIINRYKKDFGKIQIHLTGGDAIFFEKQLKNNIFADPILTLKGLYALLLYNKNEIKAKK